MASPTEASSSNSPETVASSSRAAGTSDSSQSAAITLSSTSAASATSAATPITVSSDPVFYGMAALPEENVRSDTVQEVSLDVQEISSENAEQSDEGFSILEAENDAARLAADAAVARLRLLCARALSSRASARSLASAVSRASRRSSEISHEVLEPSTSADRRRDGDPRWSLSSSSSCSCCCTSLRRRTSHRES